jgi:hypothetical protein
MKQEQRLVAELYRFLAPFIETAKPIFVSLDGAAAAAIARKEGNLLHPTVPDLWFTFIGHRDPVLIEAKILDKGAVLLMKNQLASWRTNGRGAHKPRYWVAANRGFDRFYFWTHEAFVEKLDECRAKGNPSIRPPKTRFEFTLVSELALHIIRETRQR